MEEAGFQITSRSWLESYDLLYETSREEWKKRVWAKADELSRKPGGIGPLFEAYMITPFEIPAGDLPEPSEHGEIAIYVLSRSAFPCAAKNHSSKRKRSAGKERGDGQKSYFQHVQNRIGFNQLFCNIQFIIGDHGNGFLLQQVHFLIVDRFDRSGLDP